LDQYDSEQMDSSSPQGLGRRIERLILRLGRARGSERFRSVGRPAQFVGLALFIVATMIGILALPDFDREISWIPLVVAGAVGGPLLAAFNGLEYAMTARALGHAVAPVDAMRVAVVARAANFLPIPGSVLVRSKALRDEGSTYREAFGVTAGAGVMWAAAGTLLAGIALALDGAWVAAIFLAIAAVALPLSYRLLERGATRATAIRRAGFLFAIESGMIIVNAGRLYLIMLGLDLGGQVSAAFALTLSGIISSAVGFFPGGLGLREVAAGAIAPLVDLPAAAGVVAVAVNSVISLPAVALLALVLALLPRRRSGDVGQDAMDAEAVGAPPTEVRDPRASNRDPKPPIR
jgi:uncharacterized membrane protein YbhN (UPF0104 family)